MRKGWQHYCCKWELSIHDRHEAVDGMRVPNGIYIVEHMYVRLPLIQWVEVREMVGRVIENPWNMMSL